MTIRFTRHMSNAKLAQTFLRYTDEELKAAFDVIGTRPGDRTKREGFVKRSLAKHGDLILAEIRRRRPPVTTEM